MREINPDQNKTGHKFNECYKQQVRAYFEQSGKNLKTTLKWIRQTYPTFERKILRTWVDEEYRKHINNIRDRNNRKWRAKNPEKYEELCKKNNKNSLTRYRPQRHEKNRIWRQKNLDHTKQYQKEWWLKNKEKVLAQKRERKQQDPLHKLLENTRTYIWQQLQKAFINAGKEFVKAERTCDVIGCTPSEYLENLRRQYKPGMTDDNYGTEWHVDHIIPCSTFDLTDKKQAKICFNYKNTQPLWRIENLSKGNKIL